MPRILVVASETIGGAPLLEAVRRKAQQGDATFFVVVPQTRPRHGNIVYDDAVRDAAQVRVDLTRSFFREEGIEGTGIIGDPDPFTAAMDAIEEHEIDEIIISTRPESSSGWLRKDLPQRLEDATGLPVEHVVVDIEREGLPFDVTLVAANQTAASPELIEHLERKAEEGPRRFIIVVPQESGEGAATAQARERLRTLIESLESHGIVAAGRTGDPDPYTAIMNALQIFYISEIVISTFPESSSRWLDKGLLERVQRAGNRPVDHVQAASAAPETTGAAAERA
jgi:hypothetical protein